MTDFETLRCKTCGNYPVLPMVNGNCNLCAMRVAILDEDEEHPPVREDKKTYVVAVPNPASDTQRRIAEECIAIARYLCAQNERHGDWILNPTGLMSNATARERIQMHIDDCLLKISSTDKHDSERIKELIGWLIYLEIEMRAD